MTRFIVEAGLLLLLLASLTPGGHHGEILGSAQNLVPLHIQLSPPDSGSAVMNAHIDYDRMEPLSDRPRPPLMVPAGTTNLASGRRITSSDSSVSQSELQKLVEGKIEEKDCRRDFAVLSSAPQWVQVDLGAVHPLIAVVVWHCFALPTGVFHGVVVQVADDPEFKKKVRTLFNNDYRNRVGLGEGKDKEYWESFEGKLIDAQGQAARYVRFYSAGSTYGSENRYFRIDVYGSPF